MSDLCSWTASCPWSLAWPHSPRGPCSGCQVSTCMLATFLKHQLRDEGSQVSLLPKPSSSTRIPLYCSPGPAWSRRDEDASKEEREGCVLNTGLPVTIDVLGSAESNVWKKYVLPSEPRCFVTVVSHCVGPIFVIITKYLSLDYM